MPNGHQEIRTVAKMNKEEAKTVVMVLKNPLLHSDNYSCFYSTQLTKWVLFDGSKWQSPFSKLVERATPRQGAFVAFELI